jgi:acyl carrier protein
MLSVQIFFEQGSCLDVSEKQHSTECENNKEKQMEDIKDVVLEYVIEEYVEDEDEEVTYDTPLISGGIVDSFSMVSLKRFLENRYKISIPDDEASPEAFDSVNSIVDLVNKHVAK